MKTDPAVLKYCCTLKYYCDGIFLYIWPQTAPTPAEKPALPATALSAEIPVLYRTGPGGVEREDTRVDLEYARRAGNSGRSAHTREWPGPEACGVTKELLLRKCKVIKQRRAVVNLSQDYRQD